MTDGAIRTGIAAAARCLALDQHAVVVTRALAGAGVDSMVLKGPGLARRLYAADPSRRRYSDVDILVPVADFDRAQQALAALGHTDVAARFPDDEWLWYERSWLREHPVPLTVDLHRGFAGIADPEALWRLLSATAEPLQLSGGTVRVPDAVGCALLVALHAAAPGRGRKAATDLTVALEQLPDPVWRSAARWAVATGSTAVFIAGLRRDPAGVDLVARLGLDSRRSLVGRLTQKLDLVLMGQSLEAVRSVPGAGAKLRYVARRLVPTPGFLRRASPLAQRGPAGLALAYVLRPGRLLLPAARAAVSPSGSPGRAPRRRLLQRGRWSQLRAAWWAWRALNSVRRDLADRPLDQVQPPPAPRGGPQSRRAVRAVLRRRGASCLEQSLVTQRWLARQHVEVDLVVGVTAPGAGFRAHAWLATDHDAEHSHATMTEILRRPTPAAWLA